MALLPWRRAEGWKCIRCGVCCNTFWVPLDYSEAYWLSRRYPGSVIIRRGRPYIRRINGKCYFLDDFRWPATCTIHLEKPLACRMFPIHVRFKPLHGLRGYEAEYDYDGLRLYVYIDDRCVNYGRGPPIEPLIEPAVRLFLSRKTNLRMEETSSIKVDYYGLCHSTLHMRKPFRLTIEGDSCRLVKLKGMNMEF